MPAKIISPNIIFPTRFLIDKTKTNWNYQRLNSQLIRNEWRQTWTKALSRSSQLLLLTSCVVHNRCSCGSCWRSSCATSAGPGQLLRSLLRHWEIATAVLAGASSPRVCMRHIALDYSRALQSYRLLLSADAVLCQVRADVRWCHIERSSRPSHIDSPAGSVT